MSVRSTWLDDPAQYANSSNLAARQRIYGFSTSARTWHQWVFDHFALPSDARILELGCGNAELWRQNLDRIPSGWAITLSDLSRGMLEDASRALGKSAARFRFACIDAQQIPLADGSLDALIANHMLYHVPDRPRAYQEIRRTLKPGAPLFAATNGQGQVREIMRLVEARMPGELMHQRARFTLEGGKAELKQFFARVEVNRLSGELRIPGAHYVIDYIQSLGIVSPLSDAVLAQIRRFVDEEIAKRGFFMVTTETGLFRACDLD